MALTLALMSFFANCCSVCRPSASNSAPLVYTQGVSSSAPGRGVVALLDSTASAEPQGETSTCVGETSTSLAPNDLFPFARSRSRMRISMRTGAADGGTGGDPGEKASLGKARTVELLRSRTQTELVVGKALTDGGGLEEPMKRKMKRQASQFAYADKGQTVVVFDWDDTLFPTSFINDDLNLDYDKPLEQQPNLLGDSDLRGVIAKLQLCEAASQETLRRADDLAHVVVVTLASSGWVEMACEHLYPSMGKLLKELNIPIIYAQEHAGLGKIDYDKQKFQSNEDLEQFWGLVKGRAIAAEAASFYSQYEGQTWKNILSIGDSSFERYGLMAATSAYMQGLQINSSPTDSKDFDLWHPGEAGCWQQVEEDGHVKKLRAKCCKFVDQPDIEELTVQLEMCAKWLDGMVQLDRGFDLDLEVIEDEAQVNVIEAVFRGELPASELPKPRPEHLALRVDQSVSH